tara:strand:+ start:269 stop:1843 length:1575 start_codon:yes stop_codon:yes gene_type:complete
MKKVLNSKFLFVLIFFLPFFLFLRNQNLIQINNYDIINILSFQILIIFIFFLLIFLFKFIFSKNSFNFDGLLLSSSITYFLSFFFVDLKFKELFENIIFSGFLFSILIYSIILIAIFFITYIIFDSNKFKNNFFNFILIFVILNYGYIGLNFYKFFTQKDLVYYNTEIFDIDEIKIVNSNNNIDIYFIILDGMISLEYAEQNDVIKDKEKIIRKFEFLGGSYISNSISNYPTTHLSLQSILNLNYPITEKSKKYSSYKNFFPNTLINNYEKLPITFLNNKFNRKFYWTGNDYQYCKSNAYEPNMCGKQKKLIHYLNSLEIFYEKNLLDFWIRRVNNKSLNKSGIQSTFEILNDNNLKFFKKIDFKNKNFFFMHLMKPHDPFNVDKNCNSINTKGSYKDNYQCTLYLIEKFIKNINLISEKQKIILFVGDHGYALDKNDQQIIKDEENQTIDHKIDRSKIFNLVFYPEKCKNKLNTSIVKSPVNLSRFVYNCAENLSLKYLPNKYYFTFYETHKNWGNVELLIKE